MDDYEDFIANVSQLLPMELTLEPSVTNSEEPITLANETNSKTNTDKETQPANSKKRKHNNKSPGETKSAKKKQKTQFQRKNIKKIIGDNKLNESTLKALQEEQERQKRLQEYQQQFADILNNQDDVNTAPSTLLNNGEVSNINRQQSDSTQYTLDSIEEEGEEDEEDEELIKLDDSGEISAIKEEPVVEEVLLLDSSKSDANNDTAIGHTTLNDDSDDDCQIIEFEEEVMPSKPTKIPGKGVHTDDTLNKPDSEGRVLVNVKHPPNEQDIYLTPLIARQVKPHQIGGIRFMYDNIIESLSYASQRNSKGFGCILAHSMGLGKTMQVISFVEVFLRCANFKRVLCIVPINTIQNWLAEFNNWLPESYKAPDGSFTYSRPFKVYCMNDNMKTFQQRIDVINKWSADGGVLLIGYEMFRTLVTAKGGKKATSKKAASAQNVVIDLEEEDRNASLVQALLKPCLVVCDEGHRIKNSSANTARALDLIETRRRIVLTGYPLQNNLLEYWCMVNFVRPSYLGNKAEFCNMFEKPIINGQCKDSTADDIRLMKHRAHVLHSLLEGFVQRRGHDVLFSSLPEKEEFVILVKMTKTQKEFYLEFMRSIGAMIAGEKQNPLRAFAICCKIWNHPDVLYRYVSNKEAMEDLDLPEDQPSSRSASTNDHEWALRLTENYQPGIIDNGAKFKLSFSLIEESVLAGDKILLFSQSLLSLNLIEEFLSRYHVPNTTKERWEKNKNYYRLDGSTNGLEREKLINNFNVKNNGVWLFLISTRAGCLGINLIGANRVIVLDASFNPCHDAQAVCRVYRYGQQKKCHIYRLIADHTMEKKIYDRQISKQNMSDRVIDEIQADNQFSRLEVEKLIHYVEEEVPGADLRSMPHRYADSVLVRACLKNENFITKEPFKHESLLLDKKEYQLSSEEKRIALRNYEQEKKNPYNYNRVSYSAYYQPQRSQSMFRSDSFFNGSSYNSQQQPYSSSISSGFRSSSSVDLTHSPILSSYNFSPSRNASEHRPLHTSSTISNLYSLLSSNTTSNTISSNESFSNNSLISNSNGFSSSSILNPMQQNNGVSSSTNFFSNTNSSQQKSASPSPKANISFHPFRTNKDITIPPYNYTIPAGQKVLLLNTPKGWYMRTTDNKLFAIRNPSSLMGDSTQSNFDSTSVSDSNATQNSNNVYGASSNHEVQTAEFNLLDNGKEQNGYGDTDYVFASALTPNTQSSDTNTQENNYSSTMATEQNYSIIDSTSTSEQQGDFYQNSSNMMMIGQQANANENGNGNVNVGYSFDENNGFDFITHNSSYSDFTTTNTDNNNDLFLNPNNFNLNA